MIAVTPPEAEEKAAELEENQPENHNQRVKLDASQSNHVDQPMNSQQSASKKRTIEQISQAIPEAALPQNGEKRLKTDEQSQQSQEEQVPLQASQGSAHQPNSSV